MTVIRQLVLDTALLLSAVSDSAKLDAQLLVAYALEKDVTYLHTWPERKLNAEQATLCHQLVQRRLTGEPIAYILGLKEFWSLPLFVSPATLIPRPDTEVLVEKILEQHGDKKVLTCLDLGTGTGAIALALASEQQQWEIEAIDYSHDAVVLAKKNAQQLNLTSVAIYQSDWFSTIAEHKRFDVIVSNPPYIDETDEHLNQGDVRFEPKSALVADQQGLADIDHIAEQARQYLKDQGVLYIEHGFEQGQAVREIFTRYGYRNVNTVKDYSDNDRITLGALFASASSTQ